MSLIHKCTSITSTCHIKLSGSFPVQSTVRHLGRRPPKPGKPPILPPAKKVLYHVVHKPWEKPEDIKELLWRRHIYNSAVTSLRSLFKREIEAKEAAGLGIEALKAREKEELDALLLENEKFNQERTKLRESQEKATFEQMKAEFLETIQQKLETKEAVAKKSSEEVKLIIEESTSFVTMDNLDEKLKQALENPTVFDYCIDLKGQKFYDPIPMKYVEGTPTRQKGRAFDRSLVPPRNVAQQEAQSSTA